MVSFFSKATDRYDRLAFEIIYFLNAISGRRTVNVGFAPVDREIVDDPDFAGEGNEIQLYAEILKSLPYRFQEWRRIRLLEIGAGVGAGLQYVKKHFAPLEAIGIDYSSVAAWRAQRAGMQVRQADANRLPFEDNLFDCVVAVEVGYLIHSPTVLAELRRVLKPGGCLLIAETMHSALGDPREYFESIGRRAGLNLQGLADVGNGARRSVLEKSSIPSKLVYLLPRKQRLAVLEDLFCPGSKSFEDWKSGAFRLPVALFRTAA